VVVTGVEQLMDRLAVLPVVLGIAVVPDGLVGVDHETVAGIDDAAWFQAAWMSKSEGTACYDSGVNASPSAASDLLSRVCQLPRFRLAEQMPNGLQYLDNFLVVFLLPDLDKSLSHESHSFGIRCLGITSLAVIQYEVTRHPLSH